MLPARTACPQCRSQILKFYESGYRQLLPAAPARSPRTFATAKPLVSRLSAQKRSTRSFSTTKRVFQDVDLVPAAAQAEDVVHLAAGGKAADIETLVRQARQTFGHTLPEDFLTTEEYVVYERLFGPPVRGTRPEDVGIHLIPDENDPAAQNKQVLFRETEKGELEEVDYTPVAPVAENVDVDVTAAGAVAELASLTDAQLQYLSITANNEREYHALAKLQRAYDVVKAVPIEQEENIDEPEEQDEEEQEDEDYEDDEGEPGAHFQVDTEGRFAPRLHQHTVAGKFQTDPSTVFLPFEEFTDPIAKLLNRTDTTHIRQAAEKVFGGPGLPYSPATPESKKNLPMKPIQMEAGFHRMSEIDADTFISTVLPGVYATVMSTLVEVRKRLGSNWIRDMLNSETGPRVLDIGGGGAGLAAWQEVLKAEWDVLREDRKVSSSVPPGRKTVVVGSDNLRHRVSTFLDNTTFLPRLPDYVHSGEAASGARIDATPTPQPRKVYDLIIASHALLPLDKPHKRKELIDNLWTMLNPAGGVLIVLEKGHPRGFEAVADVREKMLDEYIVPPGPQAAPTEVSSTKEPGMIIAPCTNHTKCPMYHTPGLSTGRKDFCHFNQRFIRPPFLQRIVGATHRSHEDIKFSFLAVRRGEHPSPLVNSADLDRSPFIQGAKATDLAFTGYEKETSSYAALPPHPLSLPRNILPPLKRRGHVTLDLCTPAGVIERWTVPKSFSKQAYHDARKARWGDLWALGAKTRVRREPRVGKKDKADGAEGNIIKGKDKFGGKGGSKRNKVVELTVEPGKGVVGAREMGRRVATGRDAKRNRVEDLMEELGVHEDEEVDADFEEFMNIGKQKGRKVKGRGLE
ncbi:mitochondrial small ribosomal subunit Rsm22-domain-containing protein [Coniochaeta sp. 2T2.1]|nr:mitochondrial small ribosomal subunit Rsm22-domain-containing protein [Coniochaeta sp. 2T2.1]